VERVVSSSCQLAKHRGSETLEVKDVQLCLDRSWDLRVPGFGLEEPRPAPGPKSAETHRQRMSAIAKAELQAPKRKKLNNDPVSK
jgi:transcription initiation factor TFIID subunit 12